MLAPRAAVGIKKEAYLALEDGHAVVCFCQLQEHRPGSRQHPSNVSTRGSTHGVREEKTIQGEEQGETGQVHVALRDKQFGLQRPIDIMTVREGVFSLGLLRLDHGSDRFQKEQEDETKDNLDLQTSRLSSPERMHPLDQANVLPHSAPDPQVPTCSTR